MGNREDSSITVDVVYALASAEGVRPLDLEFTLSSYISTDALDLLMRDGGGSWEISFEVPDHDVTVRHDGVVFVDGDRYD